MVREVRGLGVLLAVELVQDAKTNEPFPADRKLGEALRMPALDNGLILRIDPDWFAVCPPLVAEESDIDELRRPDRAKPPAGDRRGEGVGVPVANRHGPCRQWRGDPAPGGAAWSL